MAVRQRGETWQADASWKGKRLRQDGFATRGQAEKWEADTLARLRLGLAVDNATSKPSTGVDTLKELYDRTYNQFWKGTRGEGTACINAESVIKILGETTNPNALREGDMDFLIGKLKDQGLSGGTINRKLSALSRMLKFGHQRGWIERLPYIQHQRESEHRLRWLTDTEEESLLKWCDYFGWKELRDLFTVLIDSGLRISEALKLEWRDVADGWIRVWGAKDPTGKGKHRSVPMTDRVAAIINRRRNEAEGRETVFTLDRHQADKRWDTIREKMGLEDDTQFVIHALRHTCASRLVQAGVDLPSVQQVMGHSNITTTMRYAHIAPKNLVNAMSALQGGNPLAGGKTSLRLVGQSTVPKVPNVQAQ